MERADYAGWQKLSDASEVTAQYQRLRGLGRVITNNLSSEEELQQRLSVTDFYMAADDVSATILEKVDEIFRLYFMTISPQGYAVPAFDTAAPTVCEIYEKAGRERSGEVVKALERSGYKCEKRYDRYEITDLASAAERHPADDGEYSEIKDEADYRQIYECFEPVGAQLPLRAELSKYMALTQAVSLRQAGMTVSSAIYQVKNKIATEEYIFTPKEHRGQGCAERIEAKLIALLAARQDVRRLNAWVEESNVPSFGLHAKFGYEATSDYKLTIVKR